MAKEVRESKKVVKAKARKATNGKAEKKVKKAKVAEPSTDNFCQDCKTHRNKPSYCTLKNEYVGRKSVCEQFS
jgi:hypothetical protein